MRAPEQLRGYSEIPRCSTWVENVTHSGVLPPRGASLRPTLPYPTLPQSNEKMHYFHLGILKPTTSPLSQLTSNSASMDAHEFLLHNKESGVDRLLLCDMGNATMYGVIHVTMSGCNLMCRLCIHPRKKHCEEHLSRLNLNKTIFSF